MKYIYIFEFDVTDGDELSPTTKNFTLEKNQPTFNQETVDYARECVLMANADYSVKHHYNATLRSIKMTSVEL